MVHLNIAGFIDHPTFESMNTFSHVPPGFRFHPTDEELVDYYLRKKVASKRIDLDVIKDVDLYKIEPWDLQGSNSIRTKWEAHGNLHSRCMYLSCAIQLKNALPV